MLSSKRACFTDYRNNYKFNYQMPSIFEMSEQILCQRHREKVSKLNVSIDCPINKRVLCNMCIHSDRILKITDVESIIAEAKAQN